MPRRRMPIALLLEEALVAAADRQLAAVALASAAVAAADRPSVAAATDHQSVQVRG